MSRTPATAPIPVVRGSTWEDEFTYTDEDDVAVDLTGYEARMQVRSEAGRFGITTADTLLLELTTTNGLLEWDTAATGRLLIVVPPATHEVLNPSNVKKVKLPYAVEIFIPAVGETPEYVVPLAQGSITVKGTTIR